MHSKYHVLFGRKSRKDKEGIQSCAYSNKQACAPSVDVKCDRFLLCIDLYSQHADYAQHINFQYTAVMVRCQRPHNNIILNMILRKYLQVFVHKNFKRYKKTVYFFSQFRCHALAIIFLQKFFLPQDYRFILFL